VTAVHHPDDEPPEQTGWLAALPDHVKRDSRGKHQISQRQDADRHSSQDTRIRFGFPNPRERIINQVLNTLALRSNGATNITS
jgi:hypothetical protein